MSKTDVGFWQVQEPVAWPQSPLWMSFSTLTELEACQRRWALMNAKYAGIWEHRGYPSPIVTPALDGIVVHRSLRRIVRALAKKGCGSLVDVGAVSVLRQLGGYTGVVKESIEEVLVPYVSNPRVAHTLGRLRDSLEAKAPEIRLRTQRLLSRIRPGQLSLKATVPRYGAKPHPALGYGTYSEVPLQAPELGWRGVADVVNLSATECEICDYKTGDPREDYKYQLLIYALLWARDSELNPSRRLVDRLALCFQGFDVEVPCPDARGLDLLEAELRERSNLALSGLGSGMPPAQTSPQNCTVCHVRHLCEDYWLWIARQRTAGDPVEGHFADLQTRLSSQHGPTSWDGEVESCATVSARRPVLLRTNDTWLFLHEDQHLRVLNAFVQTQDDDVRQGYPLAVASIGSYSEVFVLPERIASKAG